MLGGSPVGSTPPTDFINSHRCLEVDAPYSCKQWKDRSTGTTRANKLLMAPDRYKKKHTVSFAICYCRKM